MRPFSHLLFPLLATAAALPWVIYQWPGFQLDGVGDAPVTTKEPVPSPTKQVQPPSIETPNPAPETSTVPLAPTSSKAAITPTPLVTTTTVFITKTEPPPSPPPPTTT